jgi:hypothetical protein
MLGRVVVMARNARIFSGILSGSSGVRLSVGIVGGHVKVGGLDNMNASPVRAPHNLLNTET